MIRPLETLSADEVRLLARDAADSGEPMNCPFPADSLNAAIWQRCFIERAREVRAQVQE